MATNQQTYEILIKNQQALASLTAIGSKVKETGAAFDGLGKALGGIVSIGFVKYAYDMAGAMSDVAKASGLSTASVLAFSKAVSINGAKTGDAINSIGKFSQAIESAANGSKEMQNRFLDLGITLNDIRTLSEQDILKRIVDGLAQGDNGTQKLAASMAIFGKTFRGVDFKGVSEDMAKFARSAQSAAPALEAANAAGDSFDNAVGKVQVELLKALKPISDLVVKILEMSDTVGRFITVAINLALVVASFTLLGKAATLVKTAFSSLAQGISAVIGFFTVAKNGAQGFGAILTNLKGVDTLGGQFRVVLPLLKEFGGWLVKNIPGLATLGAAATLVGGAIWDMIRPLLEAVGVLDDETKKSKDAADQKAREGEERRKVQSAIQGEIDALNKLVSAYQTSMAAAAAKYEVDTQALSLGEDQKNLINELSTLETNYISEVLKLRDQLLAKQQAAADGSRVDAELIPKIADAVGQLTTAYENQIQTVKELVSARNEATAAVNFELFATRNLIDKENELMDIQHRMATSTMSAIEKKYADIEFAARKAGRAAVQAEEARLKRRLNPAEAKKYYDEALKGVEELKRAHEAEYENSRKFSTGWNQAFKEYADNATNAAQTAQRLFVKATQGMEDALVNFAKTGKFEWKNFVAMMLEELLRSQIKNVFANLLGGIGGMMGGAGGLLGSLGGLLGGGGGGRGQNASQPLYVLDVAGGGGGGGRAGGIPGVGKKGSTGGGIVSTITSGIGKAFSGIGSSISDTFGNIFGSSDFGMSGSMANELGLYGTSGLGTGGMDGDPLAGLYETMDGFGTSFDSFGNNLDDFTSGFSDMSMPSFDMPSFDMPDFDFGGFFANGGTLGAGKWGIAGERGPEIVSGPANISPMGGGGATTVNYNINAVDAASFKSMIARDPQFLYAISEQGRKSIPGAR
jgi:lambda family phage tail tape measure protein